MAGVESTRMPGTLWEGLISVGEIPVSFRYIVQGRRAQEEDDEVQLGGMSHLPTH